jgi:hypothetical protein
MKALKRGLQHRFPDSVAEFYRSGQEKTKQGRVREEKLEKLAMTFTGTLIDDLMAAVDRAQQRSHPDEPSFAESIVVEPWLASVHENTDYDSKFLGVA